ncbi:MAG TPA: hypothetical protein VK158_04350 [Acidobacteriota bacterium]|nr:hypothetical protein [Acidobacteriota bacterium]
MSWFSELGFSSYPLDPRSNPDLVGVDNVEEELIEYIIQGNMCLLCGFTGSGKTSMLKKISKSPKLKSYKFVFISADGVNKQFLVDDAIKSSKSLIDLLTFRKPKRLIVLLDESHLANRILTESIKSRWNFIYPDGEKMIQSVVVSQIEPQLGTNFSGSFMDRLGKRIVKMRRLEPSELEQVLRNRLQTPKKNYVDVFDKKALDFLIKSADGSVRAMLEYTNVIFQKLHEMKDEPLKNPKFKIEKTAVFNLLEAAGLSTHEEGTQKGTFAKLLDDKKLRPAIEMFEQFGTLSAVTLAEKLDVEKKKATDIINDLIGQEGLVESHMDDGEQQYVLAPRLRHELIKA